MLPIRPDKPTGEPLRILCLGAHCDDIEIGAGGTVRRLIADREAVDVHWTVFASNPEREGEARASAECFLAGARSAAIDVRGFRESYFPDQWSAIKDAFEDVRATFDPDVVLTHHKSDAHQDHRVVSELTWNTFRNHLVLEYEIPKYDADLGRPGLFVPLSVEAVERKVADILEHFPSQASRNWFDAETLRGLMRVRGVECASPTRYAEAFHARKLIL
ncbi:MAG: PIG-L family deacetylase [bacterium]|nr:PIG-L family deacetylase [bacterium]